MSKCISELQWTYRTGGAALEPKRLLLEVGEWFKTDLIYLPYYKTHALTHSSATSHTHTLCLSYSTCTHWLSTHTYTSTVWPQMSSLSTAVQHTEEHDSSVRQRPLCVGNSCDLRGPTRAGILPLRISLFLLLTVGSTDLLWPKDSNYYYFLQFSLTKRFLGLIRWIFNGATFSKPDDARVEIFLSLSQP